LWLGGRMGRPSGKGYGSFRFRGKNRGTYRVAWLLVHGVIPKGMCVCHYCDNPICVRPSHLFLGSQQDNLSDMRKKKRSRGPDMKGTKHPAAKLVEADALAIRAAFSSCEPFDGDRWRVTNGLILRRKLAKKYGVTLSTIDFVLRRRTWSHV